jgi:hypothetical protein
VTPLLNTVVYDQSRFDDFYYLDPRLAIKFALAHELGHTLALGHGNGIDDNGDGNLWLAPMSRPRNGGNKVQRKAATT